MKETVFSLRSVDLFFARRELEESLLERLRFSQLSLLSRTCIPLRDVLAGHPIGAEESTHTRERGRKKETDNDSRWCLGLRRRLWLRQLSPLGGRVCRLCRLRRSSRGLAFAALFREDAPGGKLGALLLLLLLLLPLLLLQLLRLLLLRKHRRRRNPQFLPPRLLLRATAAAPALPSRRSPRRRRRRRRCRR